MRLAAFAGVFLLAACGGAAPPVTSPPSSTASTTPTTNAVVSSRAPIDPARVAALTGGRPEATDDAVEVSFPRTDVTVDVDGDFAFAESELQSVLKSLRASGIDIVAIHSHMTQESPRILFLHYWGRGAATDLAKAVKRALDLTAWDGRTVTT